MGSTVKGINGLVNTIMKVTGEKEETVRERLMDEILGLGTNVTRDLSRLDIKPHIYSEQLDHYYSDNDSFMYELIVYQLTRGRQNLTRRYLEIAGAHKKSSKSAPYKVLCLGDGIGVDTLVFLKHGFDVTYFEFTCKSFDFAKILWEENGVKPAVINNLSEIPHNAFDVVISSDVLEHVQDPPDVIRHISLYLRDEGLAFVLASYPAIVPNLATHLFANLDFWGRSIELFRKNKMVITADSDPKGSPHVFQKFENESVLRRKVRQSYLNKATLEVRMQEWFTKYIRSKRLANKSRDMIQSPDYLKGVVSENESPLLDLN